MDNQVSILEVVQTIRKKLWLIVLLGILGFGGAYAANHYIIKPIYESTAQILVNRATEGIGGQSIQDVNLNVQMIDTYKDIIQGPVILDEVSANLNGVYRNDELAKMTSVQSNPGSQVFSIVVQAPSANDAANIANEISKIFQVKIGDLLHVDNVAVISHAVAVFTPIAPNVPLNLVIGTILGILIGFVITFGLRYFDNTVNESEYLTEKYNWPNLGEIPIVKEKLVKEKEKDGREQHETSKSRVTL